MSAGLEHSYDEAIIVTDAELQDSQELIPEMLAKWREGYDIVNMQRRERRGKIWFKRFSAACYTDYSTILLSSKSLKMCEIFACYPER